MSGVVTSDSVLKLEEIRKNFLHANCLRLKIANNSRSTVLIKHCIQPYCLVNNVYNPHHSTGVIVLARSACVQMFCVCVHDKHTNLKVSRSSL